MRHPNPVLAGILLLLAVRVTAIAQESKPILPDPASGYRWQEAAATTAKLTRQQIAQLARDKILITDHAYRQAFSPYLDPDLPFFITSDSLLNGFHVLYEESVLRLEQANARRLAPILKFIWQNLKTADKAFLGKPELVAAAKTRAKLTVAVAMQLLGDQATPLEPPVAALVAEEVKRIETARGQYKPKWLGEADPGFLTLDYTRYRPCGFYTKTPTLQRYFRAVRWLQSIPFRVSKDEELVAILMLGNCVTYDRFREESTGPIRKDLYEFFQTFEMLVGPRDDWNLMTAAQDAQGEIRLDQRLADTREYLIQEAKDAAKRPQINDQMALPPGDSTQAAELSFRVVAAHRTPDAVLFQRTTDPRRFHRPFPTGLEVAAALGSSYAKSRLGGDAKENLLAEIDACKSLFSGEGLYCSYLRCLEALLAAPEPGAPAFMTGVPWRIKTCQAVLGGWAQLRHTWTLQAKLSVMYLSCPTEIPPGFVEPVPEFFARMANFVQETTATLKKAGAFSSDPKDAVQDIRDGIALLEKLTVPKPSLSNLSLQDRTLFQKMCAVGRALEKDGKLQTLDIRKLIPKLQKLADSLEHVPTPQELTIAKGLRTWDSDISEQWLNLERLCRQLESLAHKQLRGVAFSGEENAFVRAYGEKLGGVMLYGGNSYSTPNDDAPRIVNVFSNPDPTTLGHLEVGIGRPQTIFVLYPVKKGEILCRGAVLPYYEFVHDAPLTDTEWKSLLDSGHSPKRPDWIAPINTPGSPAAPKPEAGE